MIIMREIIIFTVVTIANCHYDNFRPDIKPNELSYNVFGQPFVSLINETNKNRKLSEKSGTDYPTYSQVPKTGFRCDQQKDPGYYADPESGCQAFYICQEDGRSDSFLCPNGTIFNQKLLVCDWWYSSKCTSAENLYPVKKEITAKKLDKSLSIEIPISLKIPRSVGYRRNLFRGYGTVDRNYLHEEK